MVDENGRMAKEKERGRLSENAKEVGDKSGRKMKKRERKIEDWEKMRGWKRMRTDERERERGGKRDD